MQPTTKNSIIATLLALLAAAARAQDASAPAATDPAAPADAGGDAAAKSLQAIIMDVQGKARWRAGPNADWHDAKVNDLIDPGTEVRTGLRSRVTMRVGRNATVLVDSGTSFELPELVMEGQTLRTTATVRTGRVDFKVDKVGFANDFKVVTPQTTLAVRGTGFSLSTGPLNGFEVTGARTNAINAIELRYAQQNAAYFLSGNAQSSSERQDPVHHAWMSTIGPPPVVGTIATAQQLTQQASQGTAGNAPTNPQQYQQQNAAESNGTGGNALIQAANEEGASDDLKNLARDVSGNEGAVPPSGDALLAQLQDTYLREELRFVRREGPAFVARMDQLSARSGELSDAASDLGDAYDVEGPIWNQLSELEPGASALVHLQRVIRDGSEALPGSFATEIARTENSLGASVFTRPAVDNSSLSLTGNDAGGGGGRPLPGTFGIQQALHNAWTWAVQDNNEAASRASTIGGLLGSTASSPGMVESELRAMSVLQSRWQIDGDRDGGGAQTPVLLALRMNEAVQSAWDSAVGAMLGNGSGSAGAAQRRVSAGMDRVIGMLRSENIGGTQVDIPDYLTEYHRVALLEATDASQQADAEFQQIVTAAKTALDSALAAAVDATNQSANARSQGQRVFMQAVSNAYVTQAASIALSCQEDTADILNRSVSISHLFRDAKQGVKDAGLLPPDLNRGRNIQH